MKIAVVWKWWSGKSSISRLLIKHISQKNDVVAIDSDHNMDLVDLLWVTFTENTITFKDNYEKMINYLEYQDTIKTRQIIKEWLEHKRFFLDSIDEFSEFITLPISKNIRLWIVWLWSDDVMEDWRCAHAMSNPLKIYLSLLDEGKTTVVVDWVAWVDMINFGLYHACDFMVIVAECSRNWIKVAAQIKHLCDMSSVNYGIVLNKAQDNEYFHEARRIFEWQIITEIGFDQWIFDYNYDLLSQDTLWKIDQIIEYAQQHQWINMVDRMMMLDKIKYDT